MHRLLVLSTLLALPALAGAADVPLAGKKLDLRASQTSARKRALRVVVDRDPALLGPVPDPRLGSSLVVNAGAVPGQCRAEIALDPAKWQVHPAGGYRYVADAPGTQGVRRIRFTAGRLTVVARGEGWPCDLTADTQRSPVSVVLRADDRRYCLAFGGTVTRNAPGRFAARNAPAPAACPETDLTVADLNILHGLFCPPASSNCRLSDRLGLLFQWIADAGCPDVVTLQEVAIQGEPIITAALGSICPFPYLQVYVNVFGIDDEMILSRYPVVASESRRLYKNFRHVLYARVDHPIGPVDVFTTHLASSGDFAGSPCSGDCPPECVTAGAATVRECQGVQMALFIEERHDVAQPAVATGDFNVSPGEFVYNQFTSRGWIDTYLAVGNPECDSGTGIGCTSGRIDNDLSQLESTASNQVERIDFAFLIPPGPGSLCAATIDGIADADGDGTTTRIFADDPNPFSPTCGPLPDPICWPSDHEGTELDVDCG